MSAAAEGPEPCAGVLVGGGAESGPGTLAALLYPLPWVAQLPAGRPAAAGGRRRRGKPALPWAGVAGGRPVAGGQASPAMGDARGGAGQPVTGVGGSFQMLTDLTYIVPEQLPGVLFSSARSRRRYMVCWGMCAVVVSASWLS
jgi:hypothetical protein